MTPALTRALFLQCLDEWGAFPEKFARLLPDQRTAFLKDQGFASLHDLLAHVGAWWQEAEGVIGDRLAGRERPPRKYDFDEFNAAALKQFEQTSEQGLLTWYESERPKMVALVSSLTTDQLKMRGVSNWLNGVVVEHLKEHGIDAPRFLTVDTLQREWGDAIERFDALSEDEQTALMARQGFARFRDLAAHIIAWWEYGLEAIDAISKDPSHKHPDPDVDAFNAKAVQVFGQLEQGEVWKKYESTRQALIELVINLPEETFDHPEVQAWLRADVIAHYYEHAV
jgi:hypothetical protein